MLLIAEFISSPRSRRVRTVKPCASAGGSYLGPQFVSEALRFAPGLQQRKQLALRFLANVDPVSIKAALEGLNPETTLAVVVSKTFTTAGAFPRGTCWCWCVCVNWLPVAGCPLLFL